MIVRSLIRVIAASGLVAAVGFLMAPRRRRGFSFNINRWPFSMRDVQKLMKVSRKFMRAVAR
ncbi:hypothetical protein NDK47_18125 [Brevibacillus ruminantium]|uniref:Uncharacterized protein n=1 Tax=Brevibacillus ruminantium TaxID=2950604 RepID=A0ABY4WB41_9BACL|nr:hypothetical protein [Brevibacillus ruminantium]USG64066.1 hypothetical protein NDK47_18125 [Brevibacillus ruminantium]